MKKLLSIFLLTSLCLLSVAQPLTLRSPVLWVKADSAVLGAASWHDISGNGYDLQPQSGSLPASFSRLNFNKSFEFEHDYFTVSGLPFDKRDMTAIVLYRVTDTAEQAIWQILIDSNRVGLTSWRLLGTWGDMRYRDSNVRITLVHTLFRNWKWSSSQPAAYEFQLLRADSLPFVGHVSECLLFDWHIDDTTLIQYISYLSLKYGITLFETDYLSSDRRMIWDWRNNPDYSYSIAGLGRDDNLGLYQKQSYMLNEKIIIGLNELAATNEDNQGTLADGEYLIWGFDSSLLSQNGIIYLDNGEEFEIYGNGLFQGTKGRLDESEKIPYNTFMTVDGSSWNGTIENYYLLIDRSGSGHFRPEDIEFYMPDYVDNANILHFSNIQWDKDANGIDRFCFTYVPVDSLLINRNLVVNGRKGEGANGGKHENMKGRKHESANGRKHERENEYRLYPNPSERDFVLEVSFVEKSDITVKLFSPDGKALDTRTASGRQNYRFSYQLSVSGQYLLEISGGGETKILKAVINK